MCSKVVTIAESLAIADATAVAHEEVKVMPDVVSKHGSLAMQALMENVSSYVIVA